MKQNGGLSHRELLKTDINTALAQSANFKVFEIRLKDMSYEIYRDNNFPPLFRKRDRPAEGSLLRQARERIHARSNQGKTS
ncbi:hypothetical protein GN277_00300 [Lachnospiraceae bacterium WCA-9-b2]|uniref:Uncharacterized protein n=1 Tax=Sporofaciens musculi TaxID=2681861 RepID=A0A7X3MCL8_9FIRM|nr:hypothetical protein [Sporofaciens musculi]MXP73938.1 hypothetical protein [Sporofaciens musculi]